MAKNIFRELENLRVQTRLTLMDKNITEDTKIIYKEKLFALHELKSYLDSFDWLSHNKTKERVKVFIQTKFNTEESVKKLEESSKTAFETSMWYASKKFKESIGDSTLSLISEGRVAEGLRHFYIKTGQLNISTITSKEVVDLLPEPSDLNGVIHTSLCRAELRILKGLTLKNISSTFAKLNSDKLSLLRHVLESTDYKYTKQRELIYRYLDNEISDIDTLILMLESIEINN